MTSSVPSPIYMINPFQFDRIIYVYPVNEPVNPTGGTSGQTYDCRPGPAQIRL